MERQGLGADIIWVSVGQMFSALLALVTMKVWTAYLEPSQVGLMALIVGSASILVGIMGYPLLQAVFIGYSAHSKNGDSQQYRAVTIRLIRNRVLQCAVSIGVVGLPLCLFLKLNLVTPLLVIGLLSIDAYRSYELMLFAAARRQHNTALLSIGDLVFRLSFVWLLLHVFHPDAYTAIKGNLLGAFLFVIVMRLTLNLEAHPGSKKVSADFKKCVEKEIRRFQRPLFPSMILANITENGSRYFISVLLGLNAAGLFVVSYGLVKRPYGMVNNIGEMAMTPVLRSALTDNDAKKVREVRRHWMLIIIAISITGAFLFYGLRKPLVSILLSNRYAGAEHLLFGLAFGSAIGNVSTVVNWFSLTLGDSGAVLINNAVGSLSAIILMLVLCPRFGLSGAVWALIISYSFQFMTSLITYRLSLRRINIANTRGALHAA